MPRPVHVFHLASFSGNTGDGAMHDGAYRTRAEDFSFPLSYTRSEIREFIQWGMRRFDDAFVAEVNRHDALFVGGVSLFQLWRTDSLSGTYFDLPPEAFSRIRCPIVLYGVGCDATRGICPETVNRVRRWMDRAMETDRVVLTLRNDGSKALLEQALGSAYTDRMNTLPDGALFAEPSVVDGTLGWGDAPYVVIQLAGDMPDVRYGKRPEVFVAAVAAEIERLMADHPEHRCLLLPNVYSDLKLAAQCVEALGDRLRRTRVAVGPCETGPESWKFVYGLLRKAQAVLAMRFHANVVSVGQGVPVSGLSSHHKVQGFYREMGLEDRCISLVPEKLMEAVSASFRQLNSDLEPSTSALVRERQRQVRNAERKKLKIVHSNLCEWLTKRL